MSKLDHGVLRTTRRTLLLGSLTTLAAATLPTDDAVVIDLTDGLCVVPVLLDGRVARMVLDTGAERTVVTRAAARAFNLRRDPWVDTPMVGAGGLVETHPNVDVGSASLGGVALFQSLPGRPLSLAVTDQSLGMADGLLGADMLRHHMLELDMPKARLMLRPAGAAPPAGSSVRLQPWAQGLLLAPIRVDGGELTALVDTGASRTLVNARGLYKLGINPADDRRGAIVTTAGLGGRFQARMHGFATLQLGRLVVRDPLLLTAAIPEAAFDVILGLDILGKQNLRLSYAALRLGLGAA